jgi:thiosulfate dehydrogenase (quinone) large subunit
MVGRASGVVVKATTPRDPALVRRLLNDVRLAPLWLPLRVAIGWLWLEAGWARLQGAAWPTRLPIQSSVAGTDDMQAIALTLLGVALMLGLLVGPGAFLGGCLLAGFKSGGQQVPAALQFAAVVWLILAWKTAGWIGLDRWFLPLLGLPWRSGALLGGSRLDVKREGDRRCSSWTA